MPADPALALPVPIRKFSIRSVVNGSFRVWLTTLPQLTVICVVFVGPTFGLTWLLRDVVGRKELQGLISLLSLISAFLMQGAIVALVFQKLRRERPNVLGSIRAGFARFLSVLGIAFVLGLSALALVFVVFFLVASVTPFMGFLFVLIVPLFLAWSVAVPSAVVEKLSSAKALARSMQLTKGSRLRLLGTLIVVSFIFYVGVFACFLVAGLIAANSGTVLLLVAIVPYAIFGSLLPVWSVAAYHELRESKEGIGLDQLASVFQ